MSAEYNIAFQEFMNMNLSTSEQHKNLTIVQQVSTKVAECSPYEPDPTLSNIVNGIVAQDDVNVHEYDSVGHMSMQKMIGKPVLSISFSRKDKAKTFAMHIVLRTISYVQTLLPSLKPKMSSERLINCS